MAETWASAWSAQWAAGARRFNTNHLPAGTGGGQFASAGGGSGSSPAAKAKAAHAAHVAHTEHETHLANNPSARKADLRSKAAADRARAHQLQAQLDVLLKQESAAAAAAKKSAAAAKTAAAAAKHPGTVPAVKHHAVTAHKASSKASAHHATLKEKITTLRTEISGILAQASDLDAQAAKL